MHGQRMFFSHEASLWVSSGTNPSTEQTQIQVKNLELVAE